jgi:hypothetical protein
MIDTVPECCETEGRVGIFMCGMYRLLPIEKAEKFVAELQACIAKAKERAA